MRLADWLQVFHLLRFHYPMRVGFISILNAGPAFLLLWKVLKRHQLVMAGHAGLVAAPC